MPQFTFILCDPLESFGTLEDFGGVLRWLKGAGFAGVEFNLTASGLADARKLLQVVRDSGLPVVASAAKTHAVRRASGARHPKCPTTRIRVVS